MAAGTLSKQKPTNTVTVQTRQGGQNVLTRLQGLLPTTPHSPPTTTIPRKHMLRSTQSERALPPLPSAKPANGMKPKAFKIRILTWNMHDSLPKGDLEELLGKVPPWSPSSSAAGIKPNLPTDAAHPYHLVVVAGQECPTSSGIPMGLGAGLTKLIDKDKDEVPRARKNPEDSPHDIPSGWTSMIEDWLCNGNGAGTRINSPTVADVGSPKPLSPRLPAAKEPRKGPYTLLTKERMMGIYLAVYIHRDMVPLVRGTSKSAVTAGLIGGRVGNKGGVGITINLDGTTFLFLNSHLAAHEGKIHHRLANLAKIKAELSVDDFLASDDTRVMAEDLTDKFDFTFLFGDLNFRLDVTRLHADWLISRKEYAQALAFDQLKNLMANGQAFVGFQEGTIDFPPTFKYDVLRTLSLSRRHKRHGSTRKLPDDKSQRVHSPDEKELDALETEGVEEEAAGEAASMASTFATSVHSRAGTDREIEDEDYFHASPSSQTMATSISKISAADKAKVKWMSLISPLSPGVVTPPMKLLRSKSKASHGTRSLVDVTSDAVSLNLLPPGRSSSSERVDKTSLRPPPMIFVSSTKSSLPSDDEDADGRGVYDSSHKQRVPSWCDRILWKTTVHPDPEPEEDVLGPLSRPRNRFGQFFANALRPLSATLRRDSNSSTGTSTTATSEGSYTAQNILGGSAPITRAIQPPTPRDKLPHSQSIEGLRVNLGSPTHNSADLGRRRSNSVTSSKTPPQIPNQPHRRATASASIPTSASTSTPNTAPTSSRWRFLPTLFSLTPAHTEPPAEELSAAPRKGDVVCLRYHTLDDRGMRRLEGRSDHRPVIGSYAVYF